jgi:N-acetylmuramoyl-L-alanine amidase
MRFSLSARILMAACAIAIITGCKSSSQYGTSGKKLERKGDEIVVCGQLFHTGAPVVLWMDPGGYDAYRTERRFAPWDHADFLTTSQEVPEITTPNRYGIRQSQIDQETFERIRGGGWDLPTLQKCVDQFVYHYDVAGVSRNCFKTLHDVRHLSVHFMLDVDGTIYQTLDLKERAWQATKANSRSVGIEIANIGAYSTHSGTRRSGSTTRSSDDPLSTWYRKDADGRTRLVLPPYLSANSGIHTPNFIAHPARNEPVVGIIQGEERRQYDLTPQQYDSLIKLTAALCTVFPKMNCDAPRESDGSVINHVLAKEQYDHYQGLVGHYHVQLDKQDPGPAFDWEKVIKGARKLMSSAALAANKREMGHPAMAVNDAPTSAPSTILRQARQSRQSRRSATASAPTTQPAR